ncbi:MAG: hypothetical protein ABSD39_21980, partial [Terriglobales bacterium]
MGIAAILAGETVVDTAVSEWHLERVCRERRPRRSAINFASSHHPYLARNFSILIRSSRLRSRSRPFAIEPLPLQEPLRTSISAIPDKAVDKAPSVAPGDDDPRAFSRAVPDGFFFCISLSFLNFTASSIFPMKILYRRPPLRRTFYETNR